ncbi:hypothetical protein [Demequina sp. NBRC 110051]|uniref:hypothetical protein n=1 Tax=Demequina sp. NBRC 110051 TaxID=1570340 RepID=UPI0009FBF7D7|nr:hypothetical protein [Demequina sp. NBRC 110051]
MSNPEPEAADGQRAQPGILLPPGWTSVPLPHAGRRHAALRRLVDSQFADSPAPASLRRQTLDAMATVLDAAASAGGILWAMSTQRVGGIPLAMSLTMYRPRPAVRLETVVTDLLGQPDVVTARGDSGTVVRRVSTAPAGEGATGPSMPFAGAAIAQLKAEYWLETTDDDGALHLVFTSPHLEAQPILLDLFDAMVATVEAV